VRLLNLNQAEEELASQLLVSEMQLGLPRYGGGQNYDVDSPFRIQLVKVRIPYVEARTLY
jgi:hypothetical protein